MNRCKWSEESELLMDYHDNEWGRPITEDQLLFEYLTLELFQSGLSWKTILHKRENFRKAFSGFSIKQVKSYDDKNVEVLLQNTGIVRHRKKIEATIENAKIIDSLINKHGSFYAFLQALPPEKMDKQKILKQAFRHFGLTTAESFLEAAGFIPAAHADHCFLAVHK